MRSAAIQREVINASRTHLFSGSRTRPLAVGAGRGLKRASGGINDVRQIFQAQPPGGKVGRIRGGYARGRRIPMIGMLFGPQGICTGILISDGRYR
jgi:hypothetical protein